MSKKQNQKSKRWSDEEDQILLNQIRCFPHNLARCFLIVSEMTGRSRAGVQSHWYTVLSKREDVLEFMTISRRHVSKNRKNGMGVESNETLWKKVVNVLKALF